jgi:erythronate-4-phosphate dehydrogenase
MKYDKIKIVADDEIPFLKGAFEPFADISYLIASEITNEKIKDADALLIRTRTKCDETLLENTNIKFIATATIGFDHIDTSYCDLNNIKWINAPGCNSSSVMQYVASALLTISKKENILLSEKSIGIIGVGNVGSKVEKFAKVMGMKVLLYDPPRERKEGSDKFVEMEELISESDIITFHVPLTFDGIDKTFHMVNPEFIKMLYKNKSIINSSRGPVVDTIVLKSAIKNNVINNCVIDVWENEPDIDRELLELVDIGTPHIAGYSMEGKANGTAICVRGINSFFNLGMDNEWFPDKIPSPDNSGEIIINCRGKSDQDIIFEAILTSYDIMQDDERLRDSIDTFESQRDNYPIRREFSFYNVKLIDENSEITKKLNEIGFNIVKSQI